MRARIIRALAVLGVFIVVSILLLRNGPGFGFGQRTNIGSEIPTFLQPLPPASRKSHPILQLISNAEKESDVEVKRQSKTLREAVLEYRRRYRVPPPPNFDKWFDFARDRGVEIIDDYDTIYDSLLPFWSLPPAVIRERAREALGYDNALVGILVRNGEVVNTAGASEWQEGSTVGMMADFVKYLPDMDLCFNKHDEPRVILPFDDLDRLVKNASSKALPAAFANRHPVNQWSPRPRDMDDGTRFPDLRITRFNRFAHQPTWTHSRLSCPPDSPSRALDGKGVDDTESYAYTNFQFVRNKTAFSDICKSPSLSSTYGFFDRPNAFDIVHDLFPIFSQSKISSFQDILYPSPWYWSNKVPYNENDDIRWQEKENLMYWRGSTTGGFSRDGGWRRQHRQRVVQKINARDNTLVFLNGSASGEQKWGYAERPRSDFAALFDVHFSHVGQCDPGDCDAQREFFDIAQGAAQEHAWKYKYLLDMDGNAFSGRFYAFLLSRSLVFKMALFREWHEEWIKPWVHYIPLGLNGTEYVEAVRYFDQEEEGRMLGRRVADRGRNWASRVLRKGDMEAWFFRLLLEYGRLIDDDRERLGFKI